MKRPYSPSNGTEGACFIERWCEQCIRFPISHDAKHQCKYFLDSLVKDHNGKWFTNDKGVNECISFRSRKDAYANRKRSIRKNKNQICMF